MCGPFVVLSAVRSLGYFGVITMSPLVSVPAALYAGDDHVMLNVSVRPLP